MRLLLALLASCSLVAARDVEQLKQKTLLVSRTDTNEAICVLPLTTSSHLGMVPTFQLDKLRFAAGVGKSDWGWLAEWTLQNFTQDSIVEGRQEWIVAADRPFQLIKPNYEENRGLHILASQISLWLSKANSGGILIQVDHLNNQVKETTVKYCDRLPEEKEANCSTVAYKNGTNYLNGGKKWAVLLISVIDTRLELYARQPGNLELIANWTWNAANKPKGISSVGLDLMVKSAKGNAAFFRPGYFIPGDLEKNNKITRTYLHRSSKGLCLNVHWNNRLPNESQDYLQVKNVVSGLLAAAKVTKHDKDHATYEFEQLDAGQYQISALYKRYPYAIDLCPGDNILKTWPQDGVPKAIANCHYNAGWKDEFTVGTSSTHDPKLQPSWSLDEWANVCERLAIGPNDDQVPIKMCNFFGCNHAKCPPTSNPADQKRPFPISPSSNPQTGTSVQN